MTAPVTHCETCAAPLLLVREGRTRCAACKPDFYRLGDLLPGVVDQLAERAAQRRVDEHRTEQDGAET